MTTSWKCHTGNVLVFESSGVQVFAGGDSRDCNPAAVDIIIDLANQIRTWNFPSGWGAGRYTKQVVSMYVQDYKAPPAWANREFWSQLWTDLVEEGQRRDGTVKILVMCMGGHGRTGTVVACLALAAEAVPADQVDLDPVAWVRARYCEEAVEAACQMDYIEVVFGVKIEAPLPNKGWSGGGGSWQGSGFVGNTAKGTTTKPAPAKATKVNKVNEHTPPTVDGDDPAEHWYDRVDRDEWEGYLNEEERAYAERLTGKPIAQMTDQEFRDYIDLLDEMNDTFHGF